MSEENTSDTAPPVKVETGLTFGLELEFILATVDADKHDPHPKDPREVDGKNLNSIYNIDQDICKKLRAVGIPSVVLGDETTEEESKTCWLLKGDITVGDDKAFPDRIPKEWNELYTKNGMEIVSPPYYYSESAKDTITKVLRTIRQNCRVCVDHTAGLHVHVGNSYNGLQFPILKQLFAIAYTYEPQLMLMFPSERVSNNFWCPPLFQSRSSRENPGLTRAQILENILEYPDNNSLLNNFGESLDLGRLAFKLAVCVKFVEKACFAKSDDLFTQLRQDVSKPIGFSEGDLGAIDFLMWLGCPAQAYYYGITMITMDKKAFEKRIQDDAACRENFLKWASANLIRLAKEAAEAAAAGAGKDSSEESESTTNSGESADKVEDDQEEGSNESGDSGGTSSNSNKNES
ncbi:hypothetical protein H4I96_12255 [Botrytis cinerea]